MVKKLMLFISNLHKAKAIGFYSRRICDVKIIFKLVTWKYGKKTCLQVIPNTSCHVQTAVSTVGNSRMLGNVDEVSSNFSFYNRSRTNISCSLQAPGVLAPKHTQKRRENMATSIAIATATEAYKQLNGVSANTWDWLKTLSINGFLRKLYKDNI